MAWENGDWYGAMMILPKMKVPEPVTNLLQKVLKKPWQPGGPGFVGIAVSFDPLTGAGGGSNPYWSAGKLQDFQRPG